MSAETLAREPAVSRAASVDPLAVAGVLSEVADAVSETLDLEEVFDRVAASVSKLVPFSSMAVVRIVDGERAILHAFSERREDLPERREKPLTNWSPRWRPRPEPFRIDDAPAELDPAFPMDAMLLEKPLGSTLWEPFRQGGSFVGGISLSSFDRHAFREEHHKMMRPVAALLGSAVEHWRMWDAERRRGERIQRLETLLGTLAESLDVREV